MSAVAFNSWRQFETVGLKPAIDGEPKSLHNLGAQSVVQSDSPLWRNFFPGFSALTERLFLAPVKLIDCRSSVQRLRDDDTENRCSLNAGGRGSIGDASCSSRLSLLRSNKRYLRRQHSENSDGVSDLRPGKAVTYLPAMKGDAREGVERNAWLRGNSGTQ